MIHADTRESMKQAVERGKGLLQAHTIFINIIMVNSLCLVSIARGIGSRVIGLVVRCH